MTAPPPRVRAIAVGLVRDEERLLVAEGVDESKGGEVFYRPLGGTIEFGETAADTVVREFREEMGAEVAASQLLGVLENRFVYEGAPGHEIVMVFEAALADPGFTARDSIDCVEDGGIPFVARWLPLELFRSGATRLYPDGLLGLVDTAGSFQRGRPNRRHFLLGAGAVIVAPDGRVLMLKQERQGNVEWSGPGGAVEPDESVRDCAVREALEEAGLRVRLERLIRISEFWDADRMTGVGFLFLARPDPWPQEVRIPPRDGITRFLDFRWCTRQEAAELDGLWEHDITRSAWPPDISVPLYDQLRTVAE